MFATQHHQENSAQAQLSTTRHKAQSDTQALAMAGAELQPSAKTLIPSLLDCCFTLPRCRTFPGVADSPQPVPVPGRRCLRQWLFPTIAASRTVVSSIGAWAVATRWHFPALCAALPHRWSVERLERSERQVIDAMAGARAAHHIVHSHTPLHIPTLSGTAQHTARYADFEAIRLFFAVLTPENFFTFFHFFLFFS